MAKELDFDAIKAAAESHRADMTRFLRAMISHPSESCEEGEVVACIKAEMESLGYDEVKVDGLGNVMGFMGEGDKIIAIDSHIDTVGIGNINNWEKDPYQGWEDDEIIGGRGGSVYHVTSLEDNPENPQPGSLRYGITKVKGPRTIVFDVAGIIDLKDRLVCSDPFITVAGQTAPGKGILLREHPFGFGSEGIFRFIRLRLGKYLDKNGKTITLDGLGAAGCDNTIIDHCSVGWTIDEAFSSRNGKNISFQHNLISEALNQAGHQNYVNAKHGYAATIGGNVGSFHHNLLANNEGRNLKTV